MFGALVVMQRASSARFSGPERAVGRNVINNSRRFLFLVAALGALLGSAARRPLGLFWCSASSLAARDDTCKRPFNLPANTTDELAGRLTSSGRLRAHVRATPWRGSSFTAEWLGPAPPEPTINYGPANN